MHTHIIIKAQERPCDFGACVAMTSPRVKRCKVEHEYADDGDDDLHENKCQPLAALTEDAELNAVVKDCQAQWGVWCQTGHPLDHLRQSLQNTVPHRSVEVIVPADEDSASRHAQNIVELYQSI